ncbi:MAG: hypothetical protein AAGB22_10000, partial [Bacteroidota bacterium]
SFYRYNLLGWLYEKETVDGGKTRYLYNRSGQVTLELDANGAAGERTPAMADTVSARVYRHYAYDAFGRLVRQERVLGPASGASENVLNLLAYADGSRTYTSGPYLPEGKFYDYTFTHRSTLDWQASATVLNGAGQAVVRKVTALFGQPLVEKQWYYGSTFDTTLVVSGMPNGSYHHNSKGRLTNDRNFMRGRLSHTLSFADDSWAQWQNQYPVEAVFHSYNADGELQWQFKQFNPNGIRPEAKGLLTRMDYPRYNTRGSLLEQRVDVHSDQTLDLQYQYVYDGRNRLSQVYLSMDTSQVDTAAVAGSNNYLLAEYQYDDALGLVVRTLYHARGNCAYYGTEGNPPTVAAEDVAVDTIRYTYDLRDRLTQLTSTLYTEDLFYDGNQDAQLGANLSGDFNYNGNINGTSHHYTLDGHAGNPGALFEPATYWEYTYDGLNRLTAADGQVTHYDPQQANPVTHVDGAYAYDRIGNLTALTRDLHSGGTQGWDYGYAAGTNRLTGVTTQAGATAAVSAPRNYTYDAAGNLHSDNHRNLDATDYGRANLPFGLQLNVPDPATGSGSVGT